MFWLGSFTQTFMPAISAAERARSWSRRSSRRAHAAGVSQKQRTTVKGIHWRRRLARGAFQGAASMMPTNAEYLRFLPEIILTLAGVLIMFLEAVLPTARPEASIFAPALHRRPGRSRSSPAAAPPTPAPPSTTCSIVDGFATFFRVLVIAVGILVVFSSPNICAAKTPPAANSTPCCCSASWASASWSPPTS